MATPKVNILDDIVPDDGKIKLISELASQIISKDSEIEAAEIVLKELQEEKNRLETETLPAAMLSAGMEEFTLVGGIKVLLDEDMSISVPKKNLPAVCQWLRDNKHEDIIKNQVVVPVPKGLDSVVQKLEAGLKKLKLDYTREESVHSGTLKALLKEQRQKGININLKLFGAWEYRKAKVQLPK